MNANLVFLLIIGALVGASSGFLGQFYGSQKNVFWLGMALSHVALPGIAIALT